MTPWRRALGRRESAAIRRVLHDIGQGAVTFRQTMERDFRVIAWCCTRRAGTVRFPERRGQQRTTGAPTWEAHIGQHMGAEGRSDDRQRVTGIGVVVFVST